MELCEGCRQNPIGEDNETMCDKCYDFFFTGDVPDATQATNHGYEKFTAHELEIFKAALEGDIIHQKKYIEEKELDDARFTDWLSDTEALLKRVNNMFFKRKEDGE